MDREESVRKVEEFLKDYPPQEGIEVLNECLRNARARLYKLKINERGRLIR